MNAEGEARNNGHRPLVTAQLQMANTLANLANTLKDMNQPDLTEQRRQDINLRAIAAATAGQEAADALTEAIDHQRIAERAPTLTQMPTFGNRNNASEVRTASKIADFDGGDHKPQKCLDWLTKVLDSAQSAQLSEVGTTNLLKLKSSGHALTIIKEHISKGNRLPVIVSDLEVKFAQVKPTAEAMIIADSMLKLPSETYAQFSARLLEVINMAVRDIPDEEARARTKDTRARHNFLRVLPTWLSLVVEDDEQRRADRGQPKHEFWELVGTVQTAAETMSARRERLGVDKENIRRQTAMTAGLSRAKIRRTFEEDFQQEENRCYSANTMEDEMGITMDEERQMIAYLEEDDEPEDDEVIQLLRQGYDALSEDKARFTRKREDYVPKPLWDKYRGNINEIAKLANCGPRRCIKCGLEGHIMRSQVCGLHGEPLMDRSCQMCGRGLHTALKCPRNRRSDFKHPADGAAETKNEQ